MKIPEKLLRIAGIYALKGIEYIIDRIAERQAGKPQPLTYKDVEHIRSQVDAATRAARASAKTVVVPRTPNRYDE